MRRTVDRELTHWGEAAALFSLDLAQPLARFLLQADPEDTVALRDECRNAILENRAIVEAGRGPVFLRDLLRWNAGKVFERLAEFVDNRLITASQPENLQPWQAVLLGNDQSDAAITARLPPDWRATGMRATILSRLPQAAYDRLFALAIEADGAFERRAISDWDTGLIARNPEMLPPADPLLKMIYSADMLLRASAFSETPLAEPAACGEEDPVLAGAPLTVLDRRRIVLLAREVIAANDDYYAGVPVSFVSLQLRQMARNCDASRLDDPDLQNRILLAMFRPSPVALGFRDMSYLVHLISSDAADPRSRARAILNFLSIRRG